MKPVRSVDGKGGIGVLSLWAAVRSGGVSVVFRGRVGVRLESLESGEGPCALVLAQERMRSIYD